MIWDVPLSTLEPLKILCIFKKLVYFHSMTVSFLNSCAEKKLLLSKLRKASTGGMFGDTSRTSPNKIDVSTSTEDLGMQF